MADLIARPVRRRNHGRGHSYYDAEGRKVPGVTTIISNGTPKQSLIEWAGNATAAAAIDQWDELGELPPSQRLKKLQRARFEDRDAAANRGTQVHELAERLVKGEKVDVPDALAGHVESYVRFLDEFEVEPIAVEMVVVSYRFGWAGTADLIADLIDPESPAERVRWGLDLKTSRSGIFGETAVQCAGYFLGADVMIDRDGNEQPIPACDRYGAVHIRADGYSLIPLEVTDQQVRELRYIFEVAKAAERFSEYVGVPIDPPVKRERAS